jgi:membrane protein required for colicin V production
MHWLDIIILVIAAITTFTGFKIGLIKAVLTLVGIIVGVVLAGQFYEPLADRMTFIEQTNIAQAVAFAIILVVVIVIAGVLAAVLKWAAKLVMLNWVNHLGGAVFGLIMGAMFCGALLSLAGKFLDISDIIGQSALAGVLLKNFPAVLALLPEEFDSIRSFFK